MTRVYRATDSGGAALSVSGATFFPFGTARARVATRAATYAEIAAAMLAAGWTRIPQVPADDDVWTSTGESGNERLSARTNMTVSGANRLFGFYVGTKIDNSVPAVLQGSTTVLQWLVAADTTCDFQFFGDKDFMWIQVRNTAAAPAPTAPEVADTTRSACVGVLGRPSTVNTTSFLTTGAIVAGSNVSIPLPSNPVTAGYKIGDWVQIIELDPASAAAAETVRVVALTAASFVVETLNASYAAGAIIGQAPMPIALHVGTDINPDTGVWVSPLDYRRLTSDIAHTVFNEVVFAVGDTFIDNTDLVVPAGAGAEPVGSPNRRTKRFGCRTISLGFDASAFHGRVPGLVAYPKTASNFLAFYPHDTGTYDRVDTTVAGMGVAGDTIGGAAPTMTLNIVAAPFGSVVVGEYVKIWDATNPLNNGTFPITVAAAGSLTYTNAVGVVDLTFTGGYRVAPVQRYVGSKFETSTSPTQNWMFGRMP